MGSKLFSDTKIVEDPVDHVRRRGFARDCSQVTGGIGKKDAQQIIGG